MGITGGATGLKIRTHNDITVNGIRSGFTLRDSVLLRKETDYTPRIQQFALEDDELIEEPEQRQYFCAVDKSRLDYHKYLGIWICSECYQQYDTKIQDKPLKNKSGFKLRSYHNPYATFDDNDPNIVFVEGIDLNEQQNPDDIESVRSSEDRRLQHVHVKGSLADALSAMHRYEERQKQQRHQQRND